MPRPAASALRRATSTSSPASVPCTCTCRPSVSQPPAVRQASTHAAPTCREASTSSAPPIVVTSTVVQGPHAGFGFFSRSLPKRKPHRPPPIRASTSSATAALQSTSSWILHAPPQFPVDLPMPSSLSYPLSAPPPPPPAPETRPFDVRNWSPSPLAHSTAATTAASTSRATSPAPPPPSTLLASGRGRARVAAPSTCICGRVRMGCMRCRPSSTATLAARRQPVTGDFERDEEVEHRLGQQVQEQATLSTEEGGRSRKDEDLSQNGQKRVQRRRREPSGSSDSPSSQLVALLRQHSPKSLQHFRGVSVVSSRPGRNSSRKLSLDEASQSISALQRAAKDEVFLAALTVHEQLDLIRAVSTIARAVPPFPPKELLPSSSSSAASADEQARLRLRHGAAVIMRDLLSRTGLDRIDSLGSSSLSGTRSSAALLAVDVACLADDVVALAEAISAESKQPAGALGAALSSLFELDSLTGDGTPDLTASRQRNRAQNAHAALALILEALESTPYSDALDTYSSAPVALRLMHDLGAEQLLDYVQPTSSPTSQEKQRAYNDVLRRKYGTILARLEPTPSRWFAGRLALGSKEADLATTGLHLIRHLARAGSAGEAFSVWQKMGEEQDGASLRSRLSSVERLEALTKLVDGLAMDRLFADGNTLAAELEELARAIQIGGSLDESVVESDEMTSEPFVTTPHPLVPEAYRALARLAAGQGRSPILDRVLSRLAAVTSDPGSGLEPAARQMRARSRRYELDKIRAIFDSAELSKASPEEQSRLWGQLIAAHVRVNDVEGGLRTLQEMLGTGLYVPLITINVLLHGFARRGDVKRAAELFARLADGEFARLQPDSASWNALILAHSVVRDPTTAEALITEMRLSGARPNKQTWTTLLSAYVENAQWTAAFKIYRFLQSHPNPTFRPDTAVYNIMLKACILTGTPAPTVVELFRDLVARGVRPNMRTYTLVLQSVAIAGMMDVAEELFLLMDRRHDSPSRPPGMSVIEPDQFVFATLVAGYLRKGETARARAMLHEMQVRGIRTSSIAVGVIVGARVAALQQREGHISAASMQRVVQQARDFLNNGSSGEVGGPVARRHRQPVHFDRPLALGKEAIVVYSPILRSLAKQGDLSAALELFDEVLDRHDTRAAPPIELYTTLMDAFRVQVAEIASASGKGSELARSVYSIWHQLYDSVCERFVRLRPVDGLDAATARGGPPLPRFARSVDPAQAGILRVPFTILLDTATRLDDHDLIERTWRRLAQYGFAFDTSNWNALATWFIHDLQLEKALWITEHVLCRPSESSESDTGSTAAFAAELASVACDLVAGRTPRRLWQNRHEPKSPRPIDLSFLDTESAPATASEEQGSDEGEGLDGDSQPTRTSPRPTAGPVDFDTPFQRSHSNSATLATLPYRRTLEALGAALEDLTSNASLRSEKAQPTAGSADQRAALVSFNSEEAQQLYHRLVEDHPRTIRAIETLRAHRRRMEMDRYERSKGRY
ncbi:hypothetical protein JCM10908_001648 [Rhodotorula pacifica]|uniref:uncharacterized protein n=1 Tax=Rhodotorula pacifica TaxID=1495444 RepID=UPI0031828F09